MTSAIKNVVLSLVVLASTFVLTGCGGGGGGGGDTGPTTTTTTLPQQTVAYRARSSTFVAYGYDLFLVKEDGSGTINVTPNTDGFNEEFLGTSSDGRIIFSRIAVGAVSPSYDIYSVKADGTEPPVALATAPENEEFLAVTSDARVVYAFANNLYSIKADGSETSQLIGGDTGDKSFQALTSDNHVVYSRAVVVGASTVVVYDLHAAPADGSGSVINLATGPENEIFEGLTADNKIIFRRISDSNPDTQDLYLKTLDTTLEKALTDGNNKKSFKGAYDNWIVYSEEQFLAVSPTGQRTYGLGNLYAVNRGDLVPTSTKKALADSADDETFENISSDGYVIFKRVSGTNTDLYSVNVSSLSPTPLALATSLTADESLLGITTDQRLVFEVDEGGYTDLWTVNYVTGDSKANQSNTASASEIFLEVSGNVIAFERVVTEGTPPNLYALIIDTGVITQLADTATFQSLSSNGRVIYERNGGLTGTDLHSITLDGTSGNVLANTGVAEEFLALF